jgi:hypothetical protein
MRVQSGRNCGLRFGLIIADVVFVLLLAISPAPAEAGGGFRAPTAGKLKTDQPRYVRDHRKPGGVPSGGVKVKVKCTKTGKGCHSH